MDAGLRLYGLDLSAESLRQLAARKPAVSERLICADFRTWQSRRRFGYVIAIQVFQHGDAAEVAGYFAKVASMLDPGGLLFLRVNSDVDPDLSLPQHHRAERSGWDDRALRGWTQARSAGALLCA